MVNALIWMATGVLLALLGLAAALVRIYTAQLRVGLSPKISEQVETPGGALSLSLDVLSSCWVLRAQVGTWYTFSEPYQARDNDTDGSAVAHDSREDRAGASTQPPQPRTTYTQMLEHMIPMAGGREGPPPSLSRGGEFSDWVYTIPTARYDCKEVGSSRSPLTAQEIP